MSAWHIASLVVRTHPTRAVELAARLAGEPGTEVRAAQDGRLVVLIEGPDTGALAARLDAVRGMPGVLTADLVFHQVDDETEDAHVDHAP